MSGMPPASTRLPLEVIENIISKMDDTSALGAMMRVSHYMYELASKRLYTDVNVHGTGLYVAPPPVHVVKSDSDERDVQAPGLRRSRRGPKPRPRNSIRHSKLPFLDI